MMLIRILAVIVLTALLFGAATPAFAHKASDAYLQLSRGDGEAIELRVDVALRDLDLVVDLDGDGDATLTWAEVRAAWPAIRNYVGARIDLDDCTLRPRGPALERRNDGAYAALRFDVACRTWPARPPLLRYRLLAEVDPTHRGILRVDWPGASPQVQVLDPARTAAAPSSAVEADAESARKASAMPSFVAEGVHHILTGYDHVLFLLCLLLPAAMRRTAGGWAPVARLRDAVMPVAAVVTAFTVAHSITLGLAASGRVSLPASFIEPAIAATIVAAAIDNLRPIFGGRRGVVTFLFGLIHGFGFANVLGELSLPPAQFAWALLQFNLGLELGQLAIVAVVAAVLYGLRARPGYPRWGIGAGSTAAIAIGVLWFVERTADVSLLPL